MKRIIFTMVILSAFFIHSCDNSSEIIIEPDPPVTLLKVKNDILTVFRILSSDLENGAVLIQNQGVDENAIRSILGGYCQKYNYVVDCAFVNSQGIMQYIEPEEYHSFEGTNISAQEQIVRLWQTKKPVLSKLIHAVEGFWACDLEYPIINNGNLTGSLSMLLKPDIFLNHFIQPHITGLPADIWIMQTDGTIVFDPDSVEIGKNLFTDEIYKPFTELLAAGNKIISKPDGYTKYSFYSTGMKDTVIKDAYWTTALIQGTEWKIVLTHPNIENEGYYDDNMILEAKQDIYEASIDPDILALFESGNKAALLAKFQEIHQKHDFIYSISWVDQDLVGKFGFPVENSLTDYQFDKQNTEDIDFINAVESRVEAVLQLPLLEGGKGNFYLYPLFHNGKYLGMIYFIALKI